MGQTREAVAAYQEALQIDSGHAEARENLRDAEREFSGNDIQLITNNSFDFEDTLWPDITKFIKIGSMVLLLFVVGRWLFNLGYPYLVPKATFILEPDFNRVSTVTPEDLQETVDILTERSHAMGYPRVAFTLSENNEILAKIPANINAEDFIAAIDDIGLVEFVDFGLEPPAEGDLVKTDIKHQYLSEGEGIEWHTVMTNHEMTSATMTQGPIGDYQVAFSLTENGAKIFLEHTTQNVGSYLGIVLDKVVISVPIINSAIPDGQGVIQGNFSEKTADELAGILNSVPLPFPIRIKK